MIEQRCKEKVWDSGGWHKYQCSRNAKIDGYCKQHHPDSVAKRKAEREKRAEEEWQRSPQMRLQRALEKIERLEAEVEEQAKLNGMGAERELALMATIERLRGALREIANKRGSYRHQAHNCDHRSALDSCIDLAKNALKEESE